jgi:two-component system sensor histidine kinase DesK
VDGDYAPDDGPLPPVKWWPMAFSLFIVFFPLGLLKRGDVSVFDFLLTSFAVIAFMGLTATALAYWRQRGPYLWTPLIVAVIAFAVAPYNAVVVVLFLFAAGIFPWAVDGNIQRSVTLGILLMLYAEWVMLVLVPVPPPKRMWLIDVPILTVGIVAGGVWIVRMTLSIRRLARVAIRERITRDLHDVLGSALSMITLKSELVARQLAQESDREKAGNDINDIEAISRRALADVRQAIRRYRADLTGEEADVATVRSESTPINWWPMIFTIYILYLPASLYRAGGGTPTDWVCVSLAVIVFFALVAIAIVSWQRRRPFLRVVFLLTLLTVAFSHRTTSAMIFITFAAALVPWAVNGHIGRTAWLVLALVGAEYFIGAWNSMLQPETAIAQLEIWWVTVPIFTTLSTVGYLWAVRMSLRHLALAKFAERERIARDLHDVVGHTLSLITLKCELAARLLTQLKDAERAQGEIADVEGISRQALADVKRTILGDRLDNIDTEFARATSTLKTAGIAVACERGQVRIDTAHESILGFALREAVTNVVRHAEARTCSIRLHQNRDAYILEVQDDGRGGMENEGLGLRGMRERIEALGGSVLREISAGSRLTVRLPSQPVMT